MERDLTGRCGTCGFYIRLHTDEGGVSTGECRLRCWPPPLRDSATCASYKKVGTSWEGALRRKPAAGAPRRYREEAPAPRRAPIPQEIGIDMDQDEFRRVLREVLLDELGVRDTDLGDRWRGGEVVLVPGREGTQEKRVPLDHFFHKVVMIRDKLRVLEQKINAHPKLTDDEKIQMQQYVTACYGSLTTFNVLFRDRESGFIGSGKKDD